MFSRQTSESGSSERIFHVVSGPGELLYRAKKQPRSFNYRLSVASQCVATGLNGEGEGASRPNSALPGPESFLSGCGCSSNGPPCRCEICGDLGNVRKGLIASQRKESFWVTWSSTSPTGDRLSSLPTGFPSRLRSRIFKDKVLKGVSPSEKSQIRLWIQQLGNESRTLQETKPHHLQWW